MAKEICISSTPHETRLAILEDDQLAEIYYERENEYTLAGSIYNGRVTRVLPGMQSAFVDIGLERDAFLYVTDFLELDDQEESDELEKAAVVQAPREIRHSKGAAQKQQPVLETLEEEEEASAPETVLLSESPDSQTDVAAAEEDVDGQPKRWRGRRRRRGNRGGAVLQEQSAASPAPVYEETTVEELESQSPASTPAVEEPFIAREPVSRRGSSFEPAAPKAQEAAPVPFVLPGESLQKYGGEPTEAEKAEKPAPAATVSALPRFKPATLIEAPLEWDGSGLLPGESLSRHKQRAPEEEEVGACPVVEEFIAEPEAAAVEAAGVEAEPLPVVAELPAIEEVEEAAEDVQPEPAPSEAEPQLEDELEEEELARPLSAEEKREPEANASASHNIDSAAPSGFRLFDFVKKLTNDEKPAEQEEKPAAAAAPSRTPVEVELVEEEAYAAPRRERRPRREERSRERENRNRTIHEEREEEPVVQQAAPEVEEEETAGAPDGSQRRDRQGRNSRRTRTTGQGKNGRAPSRRSMQTTELPAITELLKPGQEILVQIAKEPIAKKGARITSHIALPGRFLVFMPTVSHVGVSRKIASDEERQRLKRILVHERGEASGGFIVRTAAEGASEEELRADLRFLLHLWQEINQRSEGSKSPALIYHDLSLIERILRDQVSSDFANIWVDSEADYERIVRFLNHFSPSLVRRVKLYTKELPMFEHFGIQDEISKALRSKVWLKSGGSIVINQTEALVAIDINTGKYVGKSARLEDTILKTNLDAVPEIVRQIRLRDLGGIIVIDFIDMDERKNRFKVMQALEEALKTDRAPTKVLQFNDFGLVAITRKRVKQSLERTLSVPCPTCQATGMVKSPATVCNEIWIEMRKMRKHFENADVMLRVHPETLKVLKAGNGRWLAELEEMVGKNILPKADASLHPEQFDIQG